MRIELEPDTPEAREEVFDAVVAELEDRTPEEGPLRGNITFEFHPDPEAPSVSVSLNGSVLYIPFMEAFEAAMARTRSGIKFALVEE